jgi:hypothetical protein
MPRSSSSSSSSSSSFSAASGIAMDLLHSGEVLTLYVRAGCDNKKYGACPFCQRIFMVLIIKAAASKLISINHLFIPKFKL